MRILNKYAKLLVNYCLSAQEGDKIYIDSTTLAEPLVKEVYREGLKAGAMVDINLDFKDKDAILFAEANKQQLRHLSPLYKKAMEHYDCYLYIRAPFDYEKNNASKEQLSIYNMAKSKYREMYFSRTGNGSMRRSLCEFPTEAGAAVAGMTLEEYQGFIFNACELFHEDPKAHWLKRRENQANITSLLNQKSTIRYKCKGTDISFGTQGRTWINSDGQTNMPSGEVYTSPVENSVNGTIHFSYPAVYMGNEVHGVTLYVKDGYIEKWEAKQGKAFLDKIMEIPGARRFGEAAIGTNYNISRMTKNILFDEKIGGTIHMAIGQSYLQAGGKNQSSIHWDMITDMKAGGEIYADDELIYKDGYFLSEIAVLADLKVPN